MKKLILRAIETSDADQFYKIENDFDAWSDSDTIAPVSLSQLRHYAENYDADPFACGQLRLAAVYQESPDKVIGLLDFYDISLIHSHAWIGIYVIPEERNKGVGREMIRLAEDYAGRRLRLDRLGAKILSTGAASRQLFHHSGYNLCGTIPRWRFADGKFTDLNILTKEL